MANGPQSSFGKRGATPPRGPGFHSVPEQAPPPHQKPQRPTWWKWVVGGVAALFLLSLIPTGGGSGLLGGLIGGLLAGRLMSSLMGRTAAPTPNTVRPGTPVTPAANPGQSTTQRGGFGSTGRSTSSSFGG